MMLHGFLFLYLFVSITTATAQNDEIGFATYFGGRDADFGNAVALGPGGDIWIAGVTHSPDFPVTGAYKSTCTLGPRQSCHDGFLARLSPDGRTVRFSTYLGDTTNDEITALAVDEQGYAYVTGRYRDGVLAARFDPEGRPVYVLSFGGPLTIGRALAIDSWGNLYITGETSSPSMPLVRPIHSTQGPVSCLAIGGGGIPIDAFVMKLDPDGRVLFSTYISGNGHDFGNAIAVDPLGRVLVGGGTTSTNLPLPNALQASYGGGPSQPVGTCEPGDAFVLQIEPASGRVLFGTLLGGPGTDNADSVLVGSNGVVTVSGTTRSGSGFPLTQTSLPATSEAFAARIDTSTPAFVHSRLLERPLGKSSMSPAGRITGGVGPLVQLNTADWELVQISGFGARVEDSVEADGVSVLAIGSATAADPFRPTHAMQPNNAGFHDVAIAKLTRPRESDVFVVNAASFAGPEIAPRSIAALFSPEPATEVRIQGLPARVLGTSGNQLNVEVPEGASTESTAEVTVLRDGHTVAVGSALMVRVAPAIFTADANGRGAPAAQVIRATRDGSRTEQLPFQCNDGCTLAPIDASSDEVESILVLYGTGIRNRTSAEQAKVLVGGEELAVEYAGAQTSFLGLDQVNVRLPHTLTGRGEVELVLSVDNRLSNPVRLRIR
jgi:uncharacterized protein (TIGR03437 family)